MVVVSRCFVRVPLRVVLGSAVVVLLLDLVLAVVFVFVFVVVGTSVVAAVVTTKVDAKDGAESDVATVVAVATVPVVDCGSGGCSNITGALEEDFNTGGAIIEDDAAGDDDADANDEVGRVGRGSEAVDVTDDSSRKEL